MLLRTRRAGDGQKFLVHLVLLAEIAEAKDVLRRSLRHGALSGGALNSVLRGLACARRALKSKTGNHNDRQDDKKFGAFQFSWLPGSLIKASLTKVFDSKWIFNFRIFLRPLRTVLQCERKSLHYRVAFIRIRFMQGQGK